MKFTKSALLLAILAGVSGSAVANVDVYGRANVSVQSSDEGEGSTTEIKSNASRFGVKGSEKLDNGLEVIYKMEFQVDVADDEGDNIKARNQYVGLKGGFGEVVVGRNDTAFKQSQGKLDLFNDLEGDIKRLFKGENRLGDTVSYKSMDLNGFRFLATYIAKDTSDGKSGVSTAVTYGDSGLKNSNVYVSLAADSEVKGYDAVRFGVHTKVSGVKLGAMYQTQEKVDGTADADGYLLNAAYSMGANTFKVQYQTMDVDGADSLDGISLGIDHKLSKEAKLYGFYSTFDADSQTEDTYFGIGMQYSF
ncbi:putative outer membrane porin [Pseudoalteromonas luteoviolacea B = ATCC 29581]|nr:putative outer membrane porin [Pseudoalteromonas luteoviolacea B = ATCC 29581]